MRDEVKQAAERLRLVNSCEPPLSIYGQFWSEEIAGDYAVVANAYLADRANDAENATLLTAEILQASGWSDGGYGGDRMLKDGCPDMLGVGYVAIAGVGTRKLETVGDLRKLLEALYIPAVVVVPKGGE